MSVRALSRVICYLSIWYCNAELGRRTQRTATAVTKPFTAVLESHRHRRTRRRRLSLWCNSCSNSLTSMCSGWTMRPMVSMRSALIFQPGEERQSLSLVQGEGSSRAVILIFDHFAIWRFFFVLNQDATFPLKQTCAPRDVCCLHFATFSSRLVRHPHPWRRRQPQPSCAFLVVVWNSRRQRWATVRHVFASTRMRRFIPMRPARVRRQGLRPSRTPTKCPRSFDGLFVGSGVEGDCAVRVEAFRQQFVGFEFGHVTIRIRCPQGHSAHPSGR